MIQICMTELYHHGIKGQKWGVRRYQNPDGTRTSAGKQREYYRRRVIRELKNVDDVNRIVSTLSKREQRLLGKGKNQDKWIDDEERIEMSSNIARTFIQRRDGIPVSMIEIWEIKPDVGEIAIATDPKYRGTGVTTQNINDAIKWFNSKSNTKLKDLQWNNRKENPKSGQIAEKFGFGEKEETDDWEFRVMRKNGDSK